MRIRPCDATIFANRFIECSVLGEPPDDELCRAYFLTTQAHFEALAWCILRESATQTDLIKAYEDPIFLNSIIQRTNIRGDHNPYSEDVTFED